MRAAHATELAAADARLTALRTDAGARKQALASAKVGAEERHAYVRGVRPAVPLDNCCTAALHGSGHAVATSSIFCTACRGHLKHARGGDFCLHCVRLPSQTRMQGGWINTCWPGQVQAEGRSRGSAPLHTRHRKAPKQVAHLLASNLGMPWWFLCVQREEAHAAHLFESNLGMLVTGFPDMTANLENLQATLPRLTQLLCKDVGG